MCQQNAGATPAALVAIFFALYQSVRCCLHAVPSVSVAHLAHDAGSCLWFRGLAADVACFSLSLCFFDGVVVVALQRMWGSASPVQLRLSGSRQLSGTGWSAQALRDKADVMVVLPLVSPLDNLT